MALISTYQIGKRERPLSLQRDPRYAVKSSKNLTPRLLTRPDRVDQSQTDWQVSTHCWTATGEEWWGNKRQKVTVVYRTGPLVFVAALALCAFFFLFFSWISLSNRRRLMPFIQPIRGSTISLQYSGGCLIPIIFNIFKTDKTYQIVNSRA